ncbi:MAG: TonB-dependent receptor, partial [Woeseiaceae bacterium]
ITGYRENDLQLTEDLDASPYRYLEVASDATARSVSQELRFQYADERLEGIVGLFFTDARSRNQFSVDAAAEFIAAAGGSQPAITERGSDTSSLAVFSQWEWSLTDRLALTLGGRWSDSEKTSFRRELLFSDLALSAATAGVERCFVLGPGVGPEDQPDCLTTLRIPGQDDVLLPPTVAEASGEGSWSQFSPKLVVHIELREGVMAYASYSQGYRDGGLEGVAANFREFDKEILHAYEVGVKSDLASGRLRANGTVFFYDYDDIQLELSQLRNNVVTQSVFNASEARVKGAELETNWRASESLQLSLNLGWLETEITEFDRNDPSIDPGFVQAGNEFARAPEWTASFVPVFNFPLGNGSVTWRSEVNYKSEFFRDVENGAFADEADALVLTGANFFDGLPPEEAVVAPGTLVYSERTDSRLVVNSAFSYLSADDRFELALWARNLFDEEYMTDADFVNGLGYTKVLYAAPRTYGVQVSFRY